MLYPIYPAIKSKITDQIITFFLFFLFFGFFTFFGFDTSAAETGIVVVSEVACALVVCSIKLYTAFLNCPKQGNYTQQQFFCQKRTCKIIMNKLSINTKILKKFTNSVAKCSEYRRWVRCTLCFNMVRYFLD